MSVGRVAFWLCLQDRVHRGDCDGTRRDPKETCVTDRHRRHRRKEAGGTECMAFPEKCNRRFLRACWIGETAVERLRRRLERPVGLPGRIPRARVDGTRPPRNW